MESIAKELSEKLLEDLRNIEKKDKEYIKQLSISDLTVQDLLHEIENNKFGVVQGFKMLMKLKSVLNERREIKNESQLLNSLYHLTANYKNNMSLVNKRIKKQEEKLPNLTYTPRVLKNPADLTNDETVN